MEFLKNTRWDGQEGKKEEIVKIPAFERLWIFLSTFCIRYFDANWKTCSRTGNTHQLLLRNCYRTHVFSMPKIVNWISLERTVATHNSCNIPGKLMWKILHKNYQTGTSSMGLLQSPGTTSRSPCSIVAPKSPTRRWRRYCEMLLSALLFQNYIVV